MMGLDRAAAHKAALAEAAKDFVGHCTYHGRANRGEREDWQPCCTAWGPDVFYEYFDSEDLLRCVDAALKVSWVHGQSVTDG